MQRVISRVDSESYVSTISYAINQSIENNHVCRIGYTLARQLNRIEPLKTQEVCEEECFAFVSTDVHRHGLT